MTNTDEQFAELRGFDLDRDPIASFHRWFAAARAAGIPQAEAMALATCTSDGAPSARMVLLRGADARGFCFFTNYEGRKAEELESNPRAALLWHWEPLARQVRVEGRVERVSRQDSQAYFDTRPLESRWSAWASPQSREVTSRGELVAKVDEVRRRFPEPPIPVPPFWGGYRVVPHRIEFWSGGAARLHDRFVYTQREQEWDVVRLAP